jgi:hypothetical protein
VVDDMTARHRENAGLVLRPLAPPRRYSAYAMSNAERPLSSAGREMVRLLALHWDAARRDKPAPRSARARKTTKASP